MQGKIPTSDTNVAVNPLESRTTFRILPEPTPDGSLEAVIGTKSRPAGFSESSHDTLRWVVPALMKIASAAPRWCAPLPATTSTLGQ